MKKRWVFDHVVALAVLVCMGYASANTTRSADFDGDGVVGIPDFLLFVEQFGSSRGDGTYQAKYDLDGNGVIGIPDFLLFVDSFGKEVPSQTVVVPVCDRTRAVRDSIVALVPVSTCGDVTAGASISHRFSESIWFTSHRVEGRGFIWSDWSDKAQPARESTQ